MNSFGINNRSNKKNKGLSLYPNVPLNSSGASMTQRAKTSYHQNPINSAVSSNSVISGYFVSEKSYKEIIISRINTALCCVLGFLILVCLVSYYFVVEKEIQLRKLTKETIALNYENSDMQNKLDNLQSYSNVDKTVSRLNILHRAKQVIEVPAQDLPKVNYDLANDYSQVNLFLGY